MFDSYPVLRNTNASNLFLKAMDSCQTQAFPRLLFVYLVASGSDWHCRQEKTWNSNSAGWCCPLTPQQTPVDSTRTWYQIFCIAHNVSYLVTFMCQIRQKWILLPFLLLLLLSFILLHYITTIAAAVNTTTTADGAGCRSSLNEINCTKKWKWKL